MKTGKLIEAIMQYKHIGIEELADKLGIAQSNLSTLIIGKRKKFLEVFGKKMMVIIQNTEFATIRLYKKFNVSSTPLKRKNLPLMPLLRRLVIG